MTEANDLKMVFTQNCFGVVRHGNPPPNGPFPFTLGLFQHEASEITRRVNAHESLVKALEWALNRIPKPELVRGQNDTHCANYAQAEAALTAAGVKP